MAGPGDTLSQPMDACAGEAISAVNFFADQAQGYKVNANTRVQPLICGEEAFSAVARALRGARSSINMAFWGLDPCMLLERGTIGSYDSDSMLGEILLDKAQAGVKVKIVVWNNTYGWLSGQMSGASGDVDNASGSYAGADVTDTDNAGNSTNLFKFRAALALYPNVEFKLTESLGTTPRFPSYHQKTIIIDVENAPRSTAFVMGHNMMVNYWSDTNLAPYDARRNFYLTIDGASRAAQEQTRDALTGAGRMLGLNDPATTQQEAATLDAFGSDAADMQRTIAQYGGRNFRYSAHQHVFKPYLDISSQCWGEGVGDVYHNFDRVWRANGGTPNPPHAAVAASFANWGATSGATQSQMAATYPNAGEKDIREFYFNAMTRANHYILIVDQYFRDVPLSQSIVNTLKNDRCIPTLKKVPIFVVTNSFNADWKQQGHDYDTYKVFDAAEIPVSLTRLRTREAANRKDVYVHAKLLIVDDVCYTIGSANYNQRSLNTDPEFNVGVVDPTGARNLRRRVMNMLIGSAFDDLVNPDTDRDAVFDTWKRRVEANSADDAAGRDLSFGRAVIYNPDTWSITPNHSVDAGGQTGSDSMLT